MKNWTFIHINDTQPGSPRSFRFHPAWLENEAQAYKQIKELTPELLLVGGDLTRDGSIHNFELIEAKQRLDNLNIPYHVIPGNMDTGNKHTASIGPVSGRNAMNNNVTSKQLENFSDVFGKFPWSFVHKNVRFTGLYAAVAGTGLKQEKPFWKFLEDLPQQASQSPAVHHVVMMHYALFADRLDEGNFDINNPEQYQDWYFCIDNPQRQRLFDIFKRSGVTDVLSGHIHCRRQVQEVEGIRFHKTPATSFGQWKDRWLDGDITLGFTKFNVNDSALQAQFVPLSWASDRTDGYGPGGHPDSGERDYSLAWEK